MGEWTIIRVDDCDLDSIELVRELFVEYHAWLGQSVCSYRLASEIAELPGPYASPAGRIHLARRVAADALGCVAVRPHHGEDCEIKRLYVRPTARGLGIGVALLAEAVRSARELGYRRALITTLPESMPVARQMYLRAGFVPTEQFADHSHVDDAVVMEYLALTL